MKPLVFMCQGCLSLAFSLKGTLECRGENSLATAWYYLKVSPRHLFKRKSNQDATNSPGVVLLSKLKRIKRNPLVHVKTFAVSCKKLIIFETGWLLQGLNVRLVSHMLSFLFTWAPLRILMHNLKFPFISTLPRPVSLSQPALCPTLEEDKQTVLPVTRHKTYTAFKVF